MECYCLSKSVDENVFKFSDPDNVCMINGKKKDCLRSQNKDYVITLELYKNAMIHRSRAGNYQRSGIEKWQQRKV